MRGETGAPKENEAGQAGDHKQSFTAGPQNFIVHKTKSRLINNKKKYWDVLNRLFYLHSLFTSQLLVTAIIRCFTERFNTTCIFCHKRYQIINTKTPYFVLFVTDLSLAEFIYQLKETK